MDEIDMDEIPCTIQPMKLIRLYGNKESGCGVIVVTFPSAAGVKMSGISFKNNYSASVTIKGKQPANTGDGKLKTIVKDFTLMTSPHYANESQNQFKLDFNELGCSDDLFICLHFIIRQPSPVWHKFGLEDLKFFKTFTKLKVHEEKEEKEDMSSLQEESISNTRLMEQMKTIQDLSHIIQNVKLDHEPTHFDVEGSYDINLLSYN